MFAWSCDSATRFLSNTFFAVHFQFPQLLNIFVLIQLDIDPADKKVIANFRVFRDGIGRDTHFLFQKTQKKLSVPEFCTDFCRLKEI